MSLVRDRISISQLCKQSIQVVCAADYTPEQVQALLEPKRTYETNAWGNTALGDQLISFYG